MQLFKQTDKNADTSLNLSAFQTRFNYTITDELDIVREVTGTQCNPESLTNREYWALFDLCAETSYAESETE